MQSSVLGLKEAIRECEIITCFIARLIHENGEMYDRDKR